MQAIPANPFAPPTDNGLNNTSPLNYVDVDFTYPYDVILTALQFLRDQAISTTNDADFCWRAVVIASSTGSFNVRFADSQGYFLSNGMIVSAKHHRRRGKPLPDLPGNHHSGRRKNWDRHPGHLECREHN